MINNTTVFQDYDADGATVTFAIPFQFLPNDLTTIKVYTISTAGVKALVSTNDYDLDPAGFTPTNVIFDIAPADSVGKIRVERVLPITQLMDYINTGVFRAEDHEKGLDRIVLIIQQLAKYLEFKLGLNPYDEGTVSTVLPVLEPGKALVGAADGLSWTLVDPTTFVSGSKFYSGLGAPAAGLGSDDDLYLDLVSPYTLYKKAGGAWASQGTLLGATGSAGATGAAGPEFNISQVDANVNPAVTRTRYLVKSTAARTITLPLAPSNNDVVAVKDINGTFDTYNCTIARNGQSIEGLAADYILDVPWGQYEFIFRTGEGWFLV